MKKKVLLLFIVVILCTLASAMCVSANSYENLTYSLWDGEVTITGYSSDITALEIPSEINGNPVIGIGGSAFKNCTSLAELTIPDSVTDIGYAAFNGCTSLKKIEIPDSVKNIDSEAFANCTGLNDITLPDVAMWIHDDSFENTAYYNNSANWSDNVLYIGKHLIKADKAIGGQYTVKSGTVDIAISAFVYCSSVTGITIPESLKQISSSAFYGCASLKRIDITNLSAWCETECYAHPFDDAAGKLYLNGQLLTELIIPDDVTHIGTNVFNNCADIKSVKIPGNVASIGDYAFSGCSGLTSITISEGVISIREGAFYGCCGLTNIAIPSGIVSIGDSVFRDCSNLTSVVIPESITEITYCMFYGCTNLKNLPVDDNITEIGAYAFYGCSGLTDVVIPDSVTYIHNDAFRYCSNLQSLTIGKNVKEIGGGAFSDCVKLQKLYWNAENVSSVGQTAISSSFGSFKNCGRSGNGIEVIFGEGVKNIPSSLFQTRYGNTGGGAYAPKITSVKIPESVTYIGSYAFYGCEDLTRVDITDLTAWLNINFGDYYANPLCYGGNLYLNRILVKDLIVPDGVTAINGYAFSGYNGLTSITIPESVEYMGKAAFQGCTELTRVDITSIDAWCNIEFDGWYANPLRLAKNLCLNSEPVTDLIIPDGITAINNYAFGGYSSLTSITIPGSITSIADEAFVECSELKDVFFNGNETQFNEIYVSYGNDYFEAAQKHYFYYVTLYNDDGSLVSKTMNEADSLIDISSMKKTGYTLHLYTDEGCTEEFELTTPISKNTNLYLKYTINQYTYKFFDDNANLLKEQTVDYLSVITPPENPTKTATKQYTYTFAGWKNYTEGMVITDNIEFVAEFDASVNKYTYKFVDSDNTVLKEITADYATVIEVPETPSDKDPYTFDYWENYSEEMTLTDNVVFKAVYKYKNYTVIAEGLENEVTVTYNDDYVVPSQEKAGYNFLGYFAQRDGKGTQITNKKGESIASYNVIGNLKVYPYFEATHMNRIELLGEASAMPGDVISQKAFFATDKEVNYLVTTVKYPRFLTFRSIKGLDFVEADKDSEKTVGEFNYLDIVCLYDYEENSVPVNQNLIPFEIEFDILTDAPIGNVEIALEKVMLMGEDSYSITGITNHTIEIQPKLAENIEISGETAIDAATEYTAIVSPDYTTDKSVEWSVDDENIATISSDGILTPVKNGTVTVTATAKDGSGVFSTKTVEVTAYAKINSLVLEEGVWLEDFAPEKYEYIVYVKEDITSITLIPEFSGGTLKANGSGMWISDNSKEFELSGLETVITLNRYNVTDMTDSEYIITVKKFEGTKTTISEDGKTFSVRPINIEKGKIVILALYDNGKFREMKKTTYEGKEILFATEKEYTNAKVMVWDDEYSISPSCAIETISKN